MLRRVLIVDDEQSILDGLSKALYRLCDFQGEVRAVTSGRDAIREISHFFYDICFLDIKLPDLSGIEVIKKIKEIAPNTMVVVMTACVLDGEIKRTIEKHAALFITKPLDLSQIRIFVNHILQKDKKKLTGERRRSERRPLIETVNCSVDVFDMGKLTLLTLKADIVNISRGGVGIRTDYLLGAGQVLRFNDNIEYKVGIIKWGMMVDENYRAGVQFI